LELIDLGEDNYIDTNRQGLAAWGEDEVQLAPVEVQPVVKAKIKRFEKTVEKFTNFRTSNRERCLEPARLSTVELNIGKLLKKSRITDSPLRNKVSSFSKKPQENSHFHKRSFTVKQGNSMENQTINNSSSSNIEKCLTSRSSQQPVPSSRLAAYRISPPLFKLTTSVLQNNLLTKPISMKRQTSTNTKLESHSNIFTHSRALLKDLTTNGFLGYTRARDTHRERDDHHLNQLAASRLKSRGGVPLPRLLCANPPRSIPLSLSSQHRSISPQSIFHCPMDIIKKRK